MIDIGSLLDLAGRVVGHESAPQFISDCLLLKSFEANVQSGKITFNSPDAIRKLAQAGTLKNVLDALARVSAAVDDTYNSPQGAEDLGNILISLSPTAASASLPALARQLGATHV